MAVKGKVLI